MSTGIVICSTCHREVHQDGDRDLRNGWLHCENGLPICIGASAVYPDSVGDIAGRWCGRDAATPTGSSESIKSSMRIKKFREAQAAAEQARHSFPNDLGNYKRKQKP
jgi:hypothetical protein